MVALINLRSRNPALYRVLERWVVLPWLCLLLALAQLAAWTMDREPQMTVLAYTATPVKPGGTVRITTQVKREFSRGCDVEFSRYLLDASGARRDIVSGQRMTAAEMQSIDRRTPGEQILDIDIPPFFSPGIAHLVTSYEYTCNPVHRVFWPIRTSNERDFLVSPP